MKTEVIIGEMTRYLRFKVFHKISTLGSDWEEVKPEWQNTVFPGKGGEVHEVCYIIQFLYKVEKNFDRLTFFYLLVVCYL